jgi:uncharacterized repeat protein (TIGR03803 family)
VELRTLVILFCIGGTIAAPAQTFTVLSDFNGPNGEGPFAPLVQASDNNFYGTATYGGNLTTQIAISPRNCYVGCGTIFKMTPPGQMTLLYQFCRTVGCPDGAYPIAGLVQASDGNLYGTTSTGGNANNGGTVFRMTPQGTLTTLYDFCSQPNCADGKYPAAALVEGSDGNLYGTTELGGTHGEKSNICAFNTPPKSGCGTVFRLTFAGELTTLYNFCAHAQCADGYLPSASLIEGPDGNLYGTTTQGGTNQSGASAAGTAFKITSKGRLTTLYSFCFTGSCTDGISPNGVVLGTDGNIYGTTLFGGNPQDSGGTFFQITTAGVLTTLFEFCSSCASGGHPVGVLVQASDGNFYGTTESAGQNQAGAIYSITPSGAETPLYSFCSQRDCEDGGYPLTGLVQGSDGKFYGVNPLFGNLACFGWDGDGDGCGTIFSLSLALEHTPEKQVRTQKISK